MPKSAAPAILTIPLESGGLDGKVVWLTVIETIGKLQDTTPPSLT